MRISTERLVIRPFIETDKEILISIISNPQVMRFWLKGPITIEKAREQMRHKDISFYEDEDYGMLAVMRKIDNTLIGYAGLLKQEIDGEQKAIVCGLIIGNKDLQLKQLKPLLITCL